MYKLFIQLYMCVQSWDLYSANNSAAERTSEDSLTQSLTFKIKRATPAILDNVASLSKWLILFTSFQIYFLNSKHMSLLLPSPEISYGFMLRGWFQPLVQWVHKYLTSRALVLLAAVSLCFSKLLKAHGGDFLAFSVQLALTRALTPGSGSFVRPPTCELDPRLRSLCWPVVTNLYHFSLSEAIKLLWNTGLCSGKYLQALKHFLTQLFQNLSENQPLC